MWYQYTSSHHFAVWVDHQAQACHPERKKKEAFYFVTYYHLVLCNNGETNVGFLLKINSSNI